MGIRIKFIVFYLFQLTLRILRMSGTTDSSFQIFALFFSNCNLIAVFYQIQSINQSKMGGRINQILKNSFNAINSQKPEHMPETEPDYESMKCSEDDGTLEQCYKNQMKMNCVEVSPYNRNDEMIYFWLTERISV